MYEDTNWLLSVSKMSVRTRSASRSSGIQQNNPASKRPRKSRGGSTQEPTTRRQERPNSRRQEQPNPHSQQPPQGIHRPLTAGDVPTIVQAVLSALPSHSGMANNDSTGEDPPASNSSANGPSKLLAMQFVVSCVYL